VFFWVFFFCFLRFFGVWLFGVVLVCFVCFFFVGFVFWFFAVWCVWIVLCLVLVFVFVFVVGVLYFFCFERWYVIFWVLFFFGFWFFLGFWVLVCCCLVMVVGVFCLGFFLGGLFGWLGGDVIFVFFCVVVGFWGWVGCLLWCV